MWVTVAQALELSPTAPPGTLARFWIISGAARIQNSIPTWQYALTLSAPKLAPLADS